MLLYQDISENDCPTNLRALQHQAIQKTQKETFGNVKILTFSPMLNQGKGIHCHYGNLTRDISRRKIHLAWGMGSGSLESSVISQVEIPKSHTDRWRGKDWIYRNLGANKWFSMLHFSIRTDHLSGPSSKVRILINSQECWPVEECTHLSLKEKEND